MKKSHSDSESHVHRLMITSLQVQHDSTGNNLVVSPPKHTHSSQLFHHYIITHVHILTATVRTVQLCPLRMYPESCLFLQYTHEPFERLNSPFQSSIQCLWDCSLNSHMGCFQWHFLSCCNNWQVLEKCRWKTSPSPNVCQGVNIPPNVCQGVNIPANVCQGVNVPSKCLSGC